MKIPPLKLLAMTFRHLGVKVFTAKCPISYGVAQKQNSKYLRYKDLRNIIIRAIN